MLLLCLGMSRLWNGNSCYSETHRAKMPTLPSSQESVLLILGTKYPKQPLPQQSLAQSIGTLGPHSLWGYDRTWSLYWWIQRGSFCKDKAKIFPEKLQHELFPSQEELLRFYCGSQPKQTGQAKTKTNITPVMDMPEALTTIPEPHQAHMHCSSHICLAHSAKLLRKQATSHFKTKSSRRVSHVFFSIVSSIQQVL